MGGSGGCAGSGRVVWCGGGAHPVLASLGRSHAHRPRAPFSLARSDSLVCSWASHSDDGAEAHEEDARDTATREAAAAAAAAAAEFSRRSAVLRRALPRPLVVNREAFARDTAPSSDEAVAAASALINSEALKMLESDACVFPVEGAPDGAAKKRKPLKPIEPERLENAARLVADALGDLHAGEAPPPPPEAYAAAWEAAEARLAYIPSLQRYEDMDRVSNEDALGAQKQQLQLLRNVMTKDGKKAAKLEKKLDMLLGGYKKRAAAVAAACVASQASFEARGIERQCFERLQRHGALLPAPHEPAVAAARRLVARPRHPTTPRPLCSPLRPTPPPRCHAASHARPRPLAPRLALAQLAPPNPAPRPSPNSPPTHAHAHPHAHAQRSASLTTHA